MASAASELGDASNGCEQADPATRSECLEAVRENYRYVKAALDHRRASFEWSLTASKIMFVVVLSLVFSGLLFAAAQFRRGMRATTEVEFSVSGIKMRSPVLGVVILAVSMAFFYLYARYVYPIQEVHSGEGRAGASASAEP
ncbi:MAG: hypothetical protein IT177_20895 [Acidobacteria bacterium]|nr:hypothetical protein [Acidobacteriota bacterium]